MQDILDRYEADVSFAFSQSWYNITIKKIARDAGITTDVVHQWKDYKGVVQMKITPKWKLISTHTGRRSFATNLYLSKIDAPVYSIMLITGHRTEEAFFRYIRIGKEQNAKLLLSHPFYERRKE